MRKQWLEAGIDIRVSSHQEIGIYTNQTTQNSCEHTSSRDSGRGRIIRISTCVDTYVLMRKARHKK